MNFKHFKYCILLILLWINVLKAQQPYALHLTNHNGLPSNTVFNIHQDKKGFVWLATFDGLIKYDGFSYKTYKSTKQTSTAGSHIKEDVYGRIWYENFDGYLYYIENEELKSIKQNKPLGFLSYGLTNKHLFVIQKNGIDVYDLKFLRLIKTIPLEINEAEFTTTLQNNFYVIVDNILYKIDADFKITSSDFFKDKKLKVKYIYPYNDKLYVISKLNEEKKMYFFDKDLHFLQTFSIPEVQYFQGSDVIDNVIWIHSSKGTFAYNEFGEKVYHDVFFLSNSNSGIIQDHQGNYILSSVNNGLLIIPQLNDKIYLIESNYPTRLTQNQNGYLLGTNKGELIQLDHQFQNPKKLRTISENLPNYYIFYDKNTHNTVFSDNGFSVVKDNQFSNPKSYNIALKEIVRLDEKYYAFSASGFCGLLLDPKTDKRKISIWDSVFYKNIDEHYPTIARLKKGIRAKAIDYNLKENKLVLASNIGLFTITPKGEKELKNKGNSVSASKVLFNKDQILMLDSKGNLFQINNEKYFVKLNEKLGIADSDIIQIKRDQNQLFIITSTFISIYDLENESIFKFDFQINGNQIRDILKEEDYLIVLTDDGILKLSLKAKRTKCNVIFRINKVLVNNKEIDWENQLDFDYNENNLAIHFSVLEFADKQTAVYYRINQKNWVLINKETRTIQFPSLASGEYLIEFKVGEEVNKTKIQLKITAPFWQKWWFYLIVFSILSFLIYVYFKWQSQLMQNQIRLLNEKVDLEKNLSKSMMSSIKSQMNPHFFYNALNTIQAYIFTNEKQKANAYLAKFSKLTRNVLEMSEKETILLNEEIEALKLYLELEKMRFSDQFNFDIVLENTLDKENIEFPPMLIQPYVENAIKHGLLHKKGEKELMITFRKEQNLLIVLIDDNGIGRKRSKELNRIKSEKHQSFSSDANEKRLEILNKNAKNKVEIVLKFIDKHDMNGMAIGTTVILSIPLE